MLACLACTFLYAQIPSYYTSVDFSQNGEDLKNDLTNLIGTQTSLPYSSSATDTWDVIQESDLLTIQDVLLIYGFDDTDGDPVTDRLRNKDLLCNFTGSSCIGYWNREHVYPKSLATPPLVTTSAGPGTDVHNLRAADFQMNSTRNNNEYVTGSGDAGLTTNGFYPGDEYKGDVARIIMYMYTRYPSQCAANDVGYGTSSYNTNIPDIFLNWNYEDPVSQFEIDRNEVIYSYQGNRNPYIDNPFIATLIWGGPVAPDTWGTTQDPRVQFVSNQSSISETDTTVTTNIPVTFYGYDAPVGITVTVNTASTAESEDYVLNTNSLNFNDNGTQQISVTINDDVDYDDETLILDISVSSGTADLGTSQHTISILDDELPTIIITEIMQDPNAVFDEDGEYFEIYNAGSSSVDLNGWTLSDNDGESHNISSELIIASEGFLVLGRNADTATNGNVNVNYQYSSFFLANGGDEIILSNDDGFEIDRVDYDDGTNWPYTAGAAMIYQGSTSENNNEVSFWTEATTAENITPNLGSPGLSGTGQFLDYLVYANGAWNTEPSITTSSKNAIIRANQSEIFESDILLNDLSLELNATLTILADASLSIETIDNLGSILLNSTSTNYASLITNITETTGDIFYNRHVNAYTDDGVSNDNDLVSAPLTGQTFGDFAVANSNLFENPSAPTEKAFAPFDKASGSYINYDTSVNASTLITAGTGYRAASSDGDTFIFTGTVETGNVSLNITDSGTAYADWNLIGNPYPSYVDLSAFLNHEVASGVKNIDLLEAASGVYGYDGDLSNGWDIITLANVGTRLLAPGQGFFVAADADDVAAYDLEFTPSMRTTGSDDDFIVGRNSNPLTFLELNTSTINASYNTSFYFNDTATSGLDAGYDAVLWGDAVPDFSIYSHLVEDNTGAPMALQALASTDVSDSTVPLGVVANAGEVLTFSISDLNLPTNIKVYLEDTVTSAITLLTEQDYSLTPTVNLTGTGRFFLRFSDSALSLADSQIETIQIYKDQTQKTVFINGLLTQPTIGYVYDLQGRVVQSKALEANRVSQQMDVSRLSTGIYLVTITNNQNRYTKKIVVN